MEGYVLPVQKALQGHPESPRLWATLIDKILTQELELKPTTHEPCLYHGVFNGEEILFLRQVDDFLCGAKTNETAEQFIALLNTKMTIDVKDLGIIYRYNGVDIHQTKKNIKLHCGTYIKKILNENEWLQEGQKHTTRYPIPMRNESDFQKQMELAQPPTDQEGCFNLEKKMGFKYRRAIGELLYTMVTCRPDISFPVMKLSQYSTHPAEEHYLAVKQLYLYLRDTFDDGIYFWRSTPCVFLPYSSDPLPKPDLPQPTLTKDEASKMTGYVDATWANDSSHRRSVLGFTLMLSGGCIYYKTSFQTTIALSSTESEFAAACEAGKAILFVRSILEEISLPQDAATILSIDNKGALLMANAQQPTRRTRHVEMKHFALLDWVERDLLTLVSVRSSANIADALTKALGRILHYRHFDKIMGRINLKYAIGTQPGDSDLAMNKCREGSADITS